MLLANVYVNVGDLDALVANIAPTLANVTPL
jgi:hypothetical protein